MSRRQVLSPLPGIFFRKPDPSEPPYKQEGDTVAKDDVIGLVEVMKTFHEVKSDASGTIAKFLVENEEAVMAAQPLLELDD